jgi:hypothetical protein
LKNVFQTNALRANVCDVDSEIREVKKREEKGRIIGSKYLSTLGKREEELF